MTTNVKGLNKRLVVVVFNKIRIMKYETFFSQISLLHALMRSHNAEVSLEDSV